MFSLFICSFVYAFLLRKKGAKVAYPLRIPCLSLAEWLPENCLWGA